MQKQVKIASVPESINEKINKIKFLKDSFLLFLIFLLSASAAFLMGLLAKQESMEIKLIKSELNHAPDFKIDFVLASKYGKNYYYLWCQSAKRIKKENIIYFKNAREAEKAGYKRAESCK